ncbi:MAG TPA: sigma-70 family RNA polymerase sigma factor, partial [Phycisphaerae bacterium]|nr:sigma-70 family RNA polymerase sigma factor [Phycisphaerae bacterium]
MEFQDLSADSLVQLVRDGQTAAFSAIVTRYQLDVMRKVNLLLLDKLAVEDMVQEVFFRAYTRLDQYKIGTSFKHWLLGIAKNTVLQELRRSKRYTGRLTRYAGMVENRLKEEEPPDDEDERATALLDCLQRLDSKSAELVRARYAQS